MEAVLIVPTESETRIDSQSTRQNAKRTRLKKKSTISSNGNHPGKTFVSSITKQSHYEEYEGWRYKEWAVNQLGIGAGRSRKCHAPGLHKLFNYHS